MTALPSLPSMLETPPEQRVRVVLVDDTPDIRLLLKVALEHRGPFEVVGEAGDGREGIEMVRQHRPELVLMDLAMPVMDGLEALPHIRRAVPEAKVVIVSGFERARMERDALAAGAAGYVQKGTSIRQIVAQVAEIVGLRGWETTPPPQRPASPARDAEVEIERVHAALASAAHELRGPATVLLAMSELLSAERDTIPEESFHRMLDAIERQARVLDRVTEDLLASTKAERGTLTMEPEPLPLLPMLESAALAIGPTVAVTVDCPPDVWVLADPARTQQVVGNLLTNAVKYGRAPLEIQVERTDQLARVQVVDHGNGVPDQFCAELFGQFTRAEGVRGKGIGLGLYVVKSIVEAQGGTVWYAPVHGGGASFCFTVPLSGVGGDGTVSQFPRMVRSRF